MKESTPPPACSHCNDSGFNGDEWEYKADTKEWDFCDKGCEAAEMCWDIDQADKAYSHAERCFTDHGYAMGN